MRSYKPEVVVNDVKLAGQLLTALRGKMGEANVLTINPTTASEAALTYAALELFAHPAAPLTP